MESHMLPINGRWDRLLTPHERRFDSVWNKFYNLPKVPQMVEVLANAKRKIRYGELEYYLRLMQQVIIVLIIYSSPSYQRTREFKTHQLTAQISNVVQESLESILITLALCEKVEAEEKVNALLRQKQELLNSERINRQLKNPNSEGKLENMDHLFFDFPTVYLNEIEKLLWPKWYTACFMKDYHNSSVWGHYADKHEGACLIFESIEAGGSNILRLYHEMGEGLETKPFYEIDYADKPGEVDFFRSIGQLTGDELKKLWYTDDEGNESECGGHLQSDGATFNWQESYWDRFYCDITAKTKDWEYEQECRLILVDMLDAYEDKESRKLIYDFSSLKGIIFGIRTSDKDKLRVIETLVHKYEENNRTDFKFYQAYYSPEDRRICKYEIPLL